MKCMKSNKRLEINEAITNKRTKITNTKYGKKTNKKTKQRKSTKANKT